MPHKIPKAPGFRRLHRLTARYSRLQQAYTQSHWSARVALPLTIVVVAALGTYILFFSSASAPLVGDINGDGSVNFLDLSLLLASYGQTTPKCKTNPTYSCDINNDGSVNFLDLAQLLVHYGQSITPPPPPTVSLQANPPTMTAGSSSTLTWSSTNATACSATSPANWTNLTTPSGSVTVSPATTTTYTMSCSGSGGTNQGSTTVTVNSSTGSCPLSAFTATYQPSCWQPFRADSAVNTLLPANPKLASYSAQVVSHMVNFNWQFTNSSSFNFNVSLNGRPTYFARPSDPLIKLTGCSGACKNSSGASIVGTSFHIPLNATPGTNSDSHIDVIETDSGNEYGFWQAHVNYSSGTMTANNGDEVSTISDKGTQLWVGADAGHFALSAGLVRPSELLDATNSHSYIHHALVLDVPCVANGSQSGIPSSVYPGLTATGGHIPSDGCIDSSKGDGPPYGSLLMLNMSDSAIETSGAPLWEQTLMKTMAHYGAYVSDTQATETLTIFKQSCESWTSLGAPDMLQNVFQQLGSADGTYHFSTSCQNYTSNSANYYLQSSVPIPVNKLEVVDPCVVQHTC